MLTESSTLGNPSKLHNQEKKAKHPQRDKKEKRLHIEKKRKGQYTPS